MKGFDPLDETEEAAESEPETGWVYVGQASISHSEGRIKPPAALFEEAEILDRDGKAYWSYDRITGTLIISSEKLEDSEYNTVDDRSILGPDNSYRITVPWQFFPPGHEASHGEEAAAVPEGAQVKEGERRHFVYHSGLGMHEGEIRSCYLFTDQQLADRLKGPEDLVGEFESAPKFI